MEEFNTVAVFSCLDPQSFGFLDFENLKNYLLKYKREIMKEHVNSIMRRLSSEPDGKISFREFSIAITPNAVSLGNDAAEHLIDHQKKQALADEMHNRSYTHVKEGMTNYALRDYTAVYNKAPPDSPVRQEFKELQLKQRQDPDRKFLYNMGKMTSPSKEEARLMQSLQDNEKRSTVINFCQGRDYPFDENYENVVHGMVP